MERRLGHFFLDNEIFFQHQITERQITTERQMTP